MKYIKLFEEHHHGAKNLLEPGMIKSTQVRHIKDDIYRDEYIFYYLGNVGGDHPYLCFILRSVSEGPFKKLPKESKLIWHDSPFIEWNAWFKYKMERLNISLKDYIIENNIVLEVISALEHPRFSTGGRKKSFAMIKKLKEELLQDETILAQIRAKNSGLLDLK